MMPDTTFHLSEEQLIQRALTSLWGSLGPVETMRFLALARTERVESVLRHQQWQAGLEQKAFFDLVFASPTSASSETSTL